MENLKKEVMKEDEAQKVEAEMNEKHSVDMVREWIKNNCIEFTHKEVKYRVRPLTSSNKEELDILRRKKYIQLVKDPDILFEEALIKAYKEKDIDVEAIKKQILHLESEIISFQLKLGEALEKKAEEMVCKAWKSKIEDSEKRKNILIIQKTNLLEFSLENVLMNYLIGAMAYLSLDKFENEEWVTAFVSYDAFVATNDDELMAQTGKLTLVINYI